MIIKAIGNGLSECFQCKKEGKYSLTWTSFLYKTNKDNYEHFYCFQHCKELEEKGVKNESKRDE